MPESPALAVLQAGCAEEICSTGAAAPRSSWSGAVAIGDFVRVAHRDEIAPGTGKTVDVGGMPVALFNVDGVYHVIHNSCPHEDGPLGEGELSGRVVTRPWHAYEFDVTSGECLTEPAYRVEKFEVWIEGDDILVGKEAVHG